MAQSALQDALLWSQKESSASRSGSLPNRFPGAKTCIHVLDSVLAQPTIHHNRAAHAWMLGHARIHLQ